MNQGEKKAFLWIGVAALAIAITTIYLESQRQETQTTASSPELNTVFANQGNQTAIITIPSGMTPKDLPDTGNKGATLLALYCAQCHELPPPNMHTADEWREVINRMKNIMSSRGGGMLMRTMSPAAKDWNILEKYLSNHAQIALNKETTKDLNTPAGIAFQKTCSQCHATPSPKSHTRNEWPRVVLRMKSHIIRMGRKMPSQDKLMQIIEYLQNHSKTTLS